MDRDALLSTLLNALGGHSTPAESLVRALVEDAESRERLLALPFAVDRLADLARARSGIDCATVQADLAAYIDAELEGGAPPSFYADVQTHLEQCPTCYEHYALAKRIVELQRTDAAPRWTIERRPRPAFMPSMLLVPRQEIQRAVRLQARPGMMRGQRDEQVIVYNDALPGHGDLFVEVTLAPSTTGAGGWNVAVQVEGANAPERLRVYLRCGQDVLATTTERSSVARFADVPSAWISGETEDDLEVGVSAA